MVLRAPAQSAAIVTKTIRDLASLTELATLADSVAASNAGCCVFAIPDREPCLSVTTAGISFAAMMIGPYYATGEVGPGAGRAL